MAKDLDTNRLPRTNAQISSQNHALLHHTHPWEIARAGIWLFIPSSLSKVAADSSGWTGRSLEWISDGCLICCYAAIDREFAWVNRPYMSRPAMCTSLLSGEALAESTHSKARANLRRYLEDASSEKVR